MIDVLCFRANKVRESSPWRAVKAMMTFAAKLGIGLEELKDVETFISMAERVDEKEKQEGIKTKQYAPDSNKNCSHFNCKVFLFQTSRKSSAKYLRISRHTMENLDMKSRESY